MSWAKIDDVFPEHPKVVGLSDKAFRVHVTALCYSARYLTDGVISFGFASRWHVNRIGELLEAGVWERMGTEGFRIHDYLEYNPSKEQVLAEREKAKVRKDSVRGSGERRANSTRDSEEVQLPRIPTPIPVSQPLVQELRSKELRSKGADAPNANGYKQTAPTETQDYLIRKLPVRSGKGWKAVTHGAIVKLNRQYGQAVVTQALQRAVEEGSEAKHSPYALLDAMCKDITGVTA